MRSLRFSEPDLRTLNEALFGTAGALLIAWLIFSLLTPVFDPAGHQNPMFAFVHSGLFYPSIAVLFLLLWIAFTLIRKAREADKFS